MKQLRRSGRSLPNLEPKPLKRESWALETLARLTSVRPSHELQKRSAARPPPPPPLRPGRGPPRGPSAHAHRAARSRQPAARPLGGMLVRNAARTAGAAPRRAAHRRRLHGRAPRAPARATARAPPPHALVLLHGLHGEPSDFGFFLGALDAALDAAPPAARAALRPILSSAGGDQTDGIDAAGGRVAAEVAAACAALGGAGALSFVCHSNGGLVARAALGELRASGLLRRWRPDLFLSLASPHLGVLPHANAR
jgi:hypothetical protein